ncbi:MAG: DUF86 domain-containing protein [Caldilineaceae bacterium]|nr:DUF86 domain-containing protein [Caldilineaceae bacterium]
MSDVEFDIDLLREVLRQVSHATAVAYERFAQIDSAADFTASDEGLIYLDAICMQLIAIGESIKNIDKITGGEYLLRYPQVEWKRVMGMRDVLSHHYFDIDAEIVFSVCEHGLPELTTTLQRMQDDLAHADEE